MIKEGKLDTKALSGRCRAPPPLSPSPYPARHSQPRPSMHRGLGGDLSGRSGLEPNLVEMSEMNGACWGERGWKGDGGDRGAAPWQ